MDIISISCMYHYNLLVYRICETYRREVDFELVASE